MLELPFLSIYVESIDVSHITSVFTSIGTSGGADQDKPVLEWSSRHKIATGAARGLRYLHEDCRVGCIVHRDLRPNNILLTHDFEPMVC